jgi:hypothetical protein
MTNNKNPHSNALAFSRQSDTPIEQILVSSGPVPAVQRTDSGEAARLTRIHTLDVMDDISRVQARQPLSSAGEWRIDRPTHKNSSTPSRIEYGTSTGKRPDTVTNHHSSGEPESRGVPIDPDKLHPLRMSVERPPRGVRQDKARLENARRPSRQPARDTDVSRAPLTNNDVVRSQKCSGANKKLVQVTLWVDPAVKEHLERRAREEGLSLSPAGAAFLRKAVQQDIDLQYSALLRPIIEDAIAKQMAGIATRLTWLLVRIAFDAGQTRSLVTNILGKQLDKNQPLLKTILEGSARSAKANIMRRTPQIASLISSVEQWMTEDSRGEREHKTHD